MELKVARWYFGGRRRHVNKRDAKASNKAPLGLEEERRNASQGGHHEDGDYGVGRSRGAGRRGRFGERGPVRQEILRENRSAEKLTRVRASGFGSRQAPGSRTLRRQLGQAECPADIKLVGTNPE